MIKSSGTAPGERRLNGPQTTGRDYRHLSSPAHAIRADLDLALPMRDGVRLLADVLRPDAEGRFPALVAFSPYPRQIQNSGLPLGFVEAGASDFFAPRGYAHVLVNARGTSGSGGTFTFLDAQEGRDLYDVIEAVAAQPWCDGHVGMIGISYFAMAQIAAAVERPPHLRAIFPVAVTTDLYSVAVPGGIPSAAFLTTWFDAIGTLASKGADFYRGALSRLASSVLRSELVHQRFEHFNGEAAANVLGKLMPGHAPPHPWDDLVRALTVEHPLVDGYWRERDFLERIQNVHIPTYLGCDWDNVTVHLSCTFPTYEALPADTPKRVAMMPRGGLCWPWESLHVEALAWFDRWLKGRDTGIDEGPPIRYWLEGAREWRATTSWPPPEARYQALHLRADGALGPEEGEPGAREYLYVSPLQPKPRRPNPPPLPPMLTWETAPMRAALDVAGPIEVELEAATTATDTDWIVKLVDVAPDGKETDLTQGWLRASHRALDEARSRQGQPRHPHDRAEAVTPGERLRYRVAVVTTAHRFAAGHRLRLALASCDHGGFGMLGFEHVPPAQSARQSVYSASRLLLPVLAGAA